MKKYSLKEILSLSLDVGERMLKCGAEVSRVENAITLIVKNYGVKYVEVFVLNSVIIATLRDDKTSVTESRRIMYHTTDLDELERLNDLSRRICKKNISRNKVLKEIDLCRVKKNKYFVLIGQVLAGSSFALFFGGNIKDAIAASIISVFLFLIDIIIKRGKINLLVHNFISSFLIGALAHILTVLGIGNNIDKIMIGNIMLLIPGLSMFISINDIFKGDTMSGMGRFTEGVFLALSIAAGTGLSLLILGGAF